MVSKEKLFENAFQFRVQRALQVAACCAAASVPLSASALEPERYELLNGLEVVLQPDPAATQIAVGITYYVGRRDDPAGYHGLAHLVEHMTYRGSRHLPGSLLRPMLEAGITDYNGFVSDDETTYYAVVPAQQLPLALWIESERMAFSLERFDSRTLELERSTIIREREGRRYRDARHPRFVAEALYPVGHPYRALHRSANSEESLELDHSRWFFQRWYYPRNATLTLAGAFEPMRARALIERYFGTIVNPHVVTRRAGAQAVVFDGQETIHLETPGQRSRLQMIWAVPCPDRKCSGVLDLDLIAYLLTGNREAVLTRELVQEQRVAAYANMGVSRREHHLEVALEIGLAIRESHERALAAVDDVMRGLQTKEVSAEDLRLARLRFETIDTLSSERPLMRLFQARRLSHRINSFQTAEQRSKRLRELTPSDVRRALRSFMSLNRRLIIASHADEDAPRDGKLRDRSGALRSRSVKP